MLNEKSEVLTELMNKAKFFLSNCRKLDNATIYSLRRLAEAQHKALDPDKVFSMYKDVMELQILALKSIDSIIEKFPVEATIQERQVLDAFRKLPEEDKQAVVRTLTERVKEM